MDYRYIGIQKNFDWAGTCETGVGFPAGNWIWVLRGGLGWGSRGFSRASMWRGSLLSLSPHPHAHTLMWKNVFRSSPVTFGEDNIMDNMEKKIPQPQEAHEAQSGWLDNIETGQNTKTKEKRRTHGFMGRCQGSNCGSWEKKSLFSQNNSLI